VDIGSTQFFPVWDPGPLLVTKDQREGRHVGVPNVSPTMWIAKSTCRDVAESFGSFRLSGGRTRAYSDSQIILPPMHKQCFGDGRLCPSGFLYYLLPSRKKIVFTRDATRQCAAACVRGSDQTVGGALVDKDGKWMDIRIIPYPYPLKPVIWIYVFVSVSNVATKCIYPNSFFSVFLFPIPYLYSTISDNIRIVKGNKVS
jgi:hypothetical protein